MTIQVATVYPSVSSFSGTGQLDIGPYFIPSPKRLIRAEVRGMVNFQAFSLSNVGVLANFQLWAVQYADHGSAPANIVTTADGLPWLIREQLGHEDYVSAWAPTSGPGIVLSGSTLRAEWAGQTDIGRDIDLWLSLRPPTGVSVANQNVFASLRFWWS